MVSYDSCVLNMRSGRVVPPREFKALTAPRDVGKMPNEFHELIHPRDKPGGVFGETRQMIATQKKGCMYSAGVVMQIESPD